MCPLIKYCMAAARRRSSISATVAPGTAARYSRAASEPRPAFARASASPTRSRRCLAVVPRSQLQGQAVQLGGAVEGQGFRRLLRRLPVIDPRAVVFPGPWKWMARTSGSARPDDSSTCARLRSSGDTMGITDRVLGTPYRIPA